jgi:hypothetical protein
MGPAAQITIAAQNRRSADSGDRGLSPQFTDVLSEAAGSGIGTALGENRTRRRRRMRRSWRA